MTDEPAGGHILEPRTVARQQLSFSTMQRSLWAILVASCLLAGPWAKVRAQHSGSPSLRSAGTGVYTTAQAARGRDLYAMQCRSCHTPESHTGVIFDAWWGGRLLSELFEFVQERMPKNVPGSLTAQECADVVAYLLRMNALRAGPDELSTDVAALKQIRIDKAK